MMEKTVAMWLHRRRYEALLPQIRQEQHAAKEKAEKGYARHMEEVRKKEEEERRRREQEERCVLLLLLLRGPQDAEGWPVNALPSCECVGVPFCWPSPMALAIRDCTDGARDGA